MEDLEGILGIKYSPEQQQALSEMARRANDTFRVYNPTNKDYYVLWDITGSGGRFLVPASTRDIGYGLGQAVHPRYIAFKFFKEIAYLIIAAQMQAVIDEENARRESAGKDRMGKTLDDGKEGELHFVMSRGILPNNQEKLLELLPKIILGVEREWGMDAIPYQPSEDKVKWDEVMAIINRPAQQNKQAAQGSAPLPDAVPETTPSQDTDPLKGATLGNTDL